MRLLGAIAVEQTLSHTALASFAAEGESALDRWLADALSSGLVIASSSVFSREPSYSVHPDYEQLVLRELAGRDELHDIARATRKILRDGTRFVTFEPHDLLARICAMVPPPWFNLTRFFGVFGAQTDLRRVGCHSANGGSHEYVSIQLHP